MKKNSNRYLVAGEETLLILGNGYVARLSTSTLELVRPYTWCKEGNGYLMSRSKGEATKLHRLITRAHADEYVDHIDGDPSNNTLENLRICRKQENEFNQKIRTDNTSGYRGVSIHRQSGKYRATICIDGRQRHLGLFANAADAAKAYNIAAVYLFGEFARLNVIRKVS